MLSSELQAKGFNENWAFLQAFVERLVTVRFKKQTVGLTAKLKWSGEEQILIQALKEGSLESGNKT